MRIARLACAHALAVVAMAGRALGGVHLGTVVQIGAAVGHFALHHARAFHRSTHRDAARQERDVGDKSLHLARIQRQGLAAHAAFHAAVHALFHRADVVFTPPVLREGGTDASPRHGKRLGGRLLVARGAGQVVASKALAHIHHLGANVGKGARGQLMAVLHQLLVGAGGQFVQVGHGMIHELDGDGRIAGHSSTGAQQRSHAHSAPRKGSEEVFHHAPMLRGRAQQRYGLHRGGG